MIGLMVSLTTVMGSAPELRNKSESMPVTLAKARAHGEMPLPVCRALENGLVGDIILLDEACLGLPEVVYGPMEDDVELEFVGMPLPPTTELSLVTNKSG